MHIGFLIITYGNTYLKENIESIRKFYEDLPIYIVDNKQDNNKYITEDKNIFYSKNENNNFELGGIWFGVKRWPNVEKFIILHNSMIILDKLPDFIFTNEFVPFWTARAMDYSPTVSIVEKMLASINIKLNSTSSWSAICGCCCSINTSILKKLEELNCNKLFATQKIEAVATEILFGYLIQHILKINYKKLHDFPLYEHWSRPGNSCRPYTIIKKIGQGQGSSSFRVRNILVPNNISQQLLKIYVPQETKNNNLIKLLQYIEKNIDIENFLIESEQNNLNINNNTLTNILHSVRHRMFTKKYFYDDYIMEYQNIISKKKLIFSD